MGEKVEGDNKKSGGENKSDIITAVYQFDMHCEGCAKKVRKSLKKFNGVEDVKTDCADNKLVVTGKVDPTKIKELVEEKIKKEVKLVSPQPTKAAAKEGGGGEKKSDDKKASEKKSEEKPKAVEKKEEKNEKPKKPPVATVLLKTIVHCEGCAQKIKKIVSKCEGVKDASVDLKKDSITLKGTMDMKELLPYLNVKLKRAVSLDSTVKDEGAGGGKKPQEGGGGGSGSEKPKENGKGSEKPKEGGGEKKEGGEKKDAATSGATNSSMDNVPRIEVNKMEHSPYSYNYSYVYDPRPQHQYHQQQHQYHQQQQQGQGYGHDQQVVEHWQAPYYSQPPQMFSDENPNACSIM